MGEPADTSDVDLCAKSIQYHCDSWVLMYQMTKCSCVAVLSQTVVVGAWGFGGKIRALGYLRFYIDTKSSRGVVAYGKSLFVRACLKPRGEELFVKTTWENGHPDLLKWLKSFI